jgi:hypothetical protein
MWALILTENKVCHQREWTINEDERTGHEELTFLNSYKSV